jgi:transcriptional regulator with XRE-family HTH domain
MNNIKISEIITQKRHEKSITQEELADHMGVTKAAVSKWEKEQCYPDITLLPKLAAYFNISTDKLLNYSPQLTREEIRKICIKMSADFTTKPFDGVMDEYREIIKTHYSCFSLLYYMAVMLLNHSISVEAEENRTLLLNEVKALCRRVVSDSGDALLAKEALHIQSVCCLFLNEPEEVLELLGESLRPGPLAEDSLISEAHQLTGNAGKAKEISQCGIFEHLMNLLASMTTYTGLLYESENSFETARITHERLIELMRLFNINKLDKNSAAKAYLLGAEVYCKQDNQDKAIEFLEKYVDLCEETTFPLKFKGDEFFTDVEQWLERSELGSTIPLDESMLKVRMLKSFTEQLPSLHVLHDDPRYKDILKRLTKIANSK